MAGHTRDEIAFALGEVFGVELDEDEPDFTAAICDRIELAGSPGSLRERAREVVGSGPIAPRIDHLEALCGTSLRRRHHAGWLLALLPVLGVLLGSSAWHRAAGVVSLAAIALVLYALFVPRIVPPRLTRDDLVDGLVATPDERIKPHEGWTRDQVAEVVDAWCNMALVSEL